MREERIEPAGIPAKLYDTSDGTAPLLVLGHGGGRSKDATGLRVVCIDALGHGERSTARKKRLMFWEGNHVGLPAESTRHAIAFVRRYAT